MPVIKRDAERIARAFHTAMDCPPWDENERLRAALGVVEAAQLRGEVPASVIRDVREALRVRKEMVRVVK